MAKRIKNKQLSVVTDFDYNNNKGVNLSMPSLSSDAANKGYVDNIGTFFVPRTLVNGTFVETFVATVTSTGGTITLTLEQSGGGDLNMQFSDGATLLDCTPPLTLTLVAGTDISPVENYVYIPLSTKVLTLSNTNWPSDEHIKITYAFVQSATDVENHGALINQNINDALTSTNGQGHMSHLSERLRAEGAKWFSGVDGGGTEGVISIVSGSTPDDVFVNLTSGIVYQLHKQIYGAKDTSASDIIHIVNHPTSAYTDTQNLNTQLSDSQGVSLVDQYYNLILWGVVNETGGYSPLMVNLPDGSYNSLIGAQNDLSGYDVYDIPREFNRDSASGFLIARITLKHSSGSGGTFSHEGTVNLRGKTPTSVSGGGTGGGGTTEYPDNVFKIFDNIDPTKVMNFELEDISTATTRILSVPDESGTIITDATSDYATSVAHFGLTNNPHGVTLSQLGIEVTAVENGQLLIYNSSTGDWENGNTITHDLNIIGNLYVSGTTTSINTTDMEISDNIILINSGETGAGVSLGQAGLEVDRGTETNYQFLFDEIEDTFKVGEIGSLQAVATRETSPINGAFAYWDSASMMFKTKTLVVADILDFPTLDNYVSWYLRVDGSFKKNVTSDDGIDLEGGTNVSLTYLNGVVTIDSSFTNDNNYLTGVSGTGNSNVTFTISGLTDIVWDASHNHDTVYQPLDGDLTAISAVATTGILKRTGTDTWVTITDNTANWDTAYTHSQIVTGNPHNLDTDDVSDTLINRYDKGYIAAGITGGAPTFATDVSGGTVTLGNSTVRLYTNSTWSGLIEEYAVAGNTLVLPFNQQSYVVCSYNFGTPEYQVVTNVELINESDIIPVYSTFRNTTEIHALNWDSISDGTVNRLHARFVKLGRFERQTGLGIVDLGSKAFRIDSGKVWYGININDMLQVVSTTDNISHYYHSSGVWTHTGVTQWINDFYDDGTDLVAVSAGKYVVNWLFRGVEDDKHGFIVLGNAEYDSSIAAQTEDLLDIPPLLESQGLLVGRIIVQEGTTNGIIESAFREGFITSGVINHNDLANIDGTGTYHISLAEAAIVTELAGTSIISTTKHKHSALHYDVANIKLETTISGVSVTGGITTTSDGDSADWNTAFGWGNHASAGYVSVNNYVDDVSGTGNSNVTFTRIGLGDLTWNASHNHTSLLLYKDGISQSTVTTGDIVNFVGGTNIDLDFAASGNTITINTTAVTENNYITSVGDDGSGGNGTVTFTRNGALGDLTWNASHTHDYDKYVGWRLWTDGDARNTLLTNDIMNIVGGSNVTVSYSATNNTVTIASTATSPNNYLTNVSGDGNGTVTFARGALGNLTWDASHTHTGTYDLYGGWNLSVDDSDKGNIAANEIVNFKGGTNVALDYSVTDNTITINSTAASDNNYLTNVSGSGNGTVTYTVDGILPNLTWDASHTHSYDNYIGWNLFVDSSDKGNIAKNEKINFIGGNAIDLVYSVTNDNTITINHNDTSTLNSSTNSNGVVIQSVGFDTYGHTTSLATIDLDGRYLPLTGGVLDNGLNTSLTILSDDGGESILKLHGDIEGTGRIFVGQSATVGGGIDYNGDNVPSYTGAGADFTTLYRLTASVPSWTARNANSNDNWEFKNDITAGGDIIINGGDLTINNNNGGINFNDVSKYWLRTVAGDGIAYNTVGNHIEFKGDGTVVGYIDLDDGSASFDGSVTALSFIGNASSASIWATARTITLGGDLTGNVSIDGSQNVTLSAQVVNDSHTHDNRYYTETETNNTFVNITGDVMTGALTTRDYVEVQDTGGAEGFKMQWNELDKTLEYIFN